MVPILTGAAVVAGGAVASFLAATALRRPVRGSLGWLLLAGSAAVAASGHAVAVLAGPAVFPGDGSVRDEVLRSVTFSLDAFALALAGLGLHSFGRLQRRRLGRWTAVDAGILCTALTLALVMPLLPDLSPGPVTVDQLLAYPVAAVVLLGIVLVVLLEGPTLRPVDLALGASLLPLVAGALLGPVHGPGSLVAVTLPLLSLAAWVALAVHPAGGGLSVPPADHRARPPGTRRIGLFGVLGALSAGAVMLQPAASWPVRSAGVVLLAVVCVRAVMLIRDLDVGFARQLREAENERLVATTALRLVSADTVAEAHLATVEGALGLLPPGGPAAVALAVGDVDDLSVVAIAGDVSASPEVDAVAVLRRNRSMIAAGTPVATDCGRGLLVPVLGRAGVTGCLLVLAPGRDLDPLLGAFEQVAQQCGAVLDALSRRARLRATSARTLVIPPARTLETELPGPTTDRGVTDLHRGLRAGELRCVFQPIVRLADRATVGYEALLRWEHPERGVLSPPRFLGTAMDSGLIVAIGRQVLTQVVTTAARLPLAARDLTISVNLTAQELQAPGLVDTVRTLLVANDVPAHRLCIEVTENALLSDVDVCARVLGELREVGARVHLDDFGTGYSSLSWLQQLPLDGIKIDRQLRPRGGRGVRGHPGRGRDRADGRHAGRDRDRRGDREPGAGPLDGAARLRAGSGVGARAPRTAHPGGAAALGRRARLTRRRPRPTVAGGWAAADRRGAAQITCGVSPFSLTIGRPACAQAVIPPSTLNASTPRARRNAVACSLRGPFRQSTATGVPAGSSPTRAGTSASGTCRAPSTWAAAHSSGSRTSSRNAPSGSVVTVTVGTGLSGTVWLQEGRGTLDGRGRRAKGWSNGAPE